MKKLLSTAICASLLSINLACFAESSAKVETIITPAPLQSEILSRQYSAYNVTFVNKTKTPVVVNNIRGTNLVGTESMMNTWNAPDKKSKKLLMLSPFTFGITGMMYSMKALNNVSQSKDAISEATKYSMNTMMAVLNKGTVITPEQSVQVSVLVPLDEKPQIFAVFEDTKTHEYIGVDTGK